MLTKRLTGLTMPVLTLLLVMPILTGCATTTASVATVDYGLCDDPRTPEKWDGILTPTYWKSSWPDDAIAQAKADNAVGKQLCGDQWGQ